ncbi:MAG TPA: hypothetical protein VKX45_10695 [Bryobacteraceae bacterium]|jgi:drug/metabolite transporter (DMT)-like permease|nr:hypothetical protein [Bryobacteraceae bacterium]
MLHNGVLVAIISHGMIGLSLLWDKVLLKRPFTQNLLSYVFWMGAMSVLGAIVAIFGFSLPTPGIIALAMGSGALELLAVYFYYLALQLGEASESLAIMGGFSPVATAIFGIPIIGHAWGHAGPLGFSLMVAGGFLMFLAEKLPYKRMLPPILMGSLLFGLVNVLQKKVFKQTGFVDGFVFITLGMFAASLCLLAPRSWRRQIFENTGSAEPSSKFWYFVNRFVNGLGAFGIYYAISLANPAEVDAISAIRYVIIFLGAWWMSAFRPDWLKEDFSRNVLISKVIATALVGTGIALVGLHGGPATTGR